MPQQATATRPSLNKERDLMERSLPGRLVRSGGVLGGFGVFIDAERAGHPYDLVRDERSGLWELVSQFGQRLPVRVNVDWELVGAQALDDWLNLQ